MSAGPEQLTLDGRAVPHDDVVRGVSRSRMVRRPVGSAVGHDLTVGEREAFVVKMASVLDAAGVRPGEAFYVSRVPPVDRPREGGARRSDPSTSKRAAALVAPRTGSQRWALLVQFSYVAERVEQFAKGRDLKPGVGVGLTAEEAAALIEKPGAWRRVSELLAGGFIEPTGDERKTRSGADAEVYRITDKGRDTLAAGRSTT